MSDKPIRVMRPEDTGSETPRTDAIIVADEESSYYADAAVSLCRQLERELAAAQAENKHQRQRIEYLEGATNHAGGTPLTKARIEIEQLKAKLADIEKPTLEGVCEHGQFKCHCSICNGTGTSDIKKRLQAAGGKDGVDLEKFLALVRDYGMKCWSEGSNDDLHTGRSQDAYDEIRLFVFRNWKETK